ncbi:hypothetical protein ACVGXC_17490, partial [Enterobacter hormaechei]
MITPCPIMYTIINYHGAAYLMYRGSNMIWGRQTKQTTNHKDDESLKEKATLTSL